MDAKYTSLTPELYGYVRAHASHAASPVLNALRAETEALGNISRMLIGEEQGNFMRLLVAALGVKSAVEVGTFTGYSSTCIALGLPPDGRLLCLDASADWTAIARRYWKKAGVDARIELRLGKAADLLRTLDAEERFDFAFIDADKPGYDTYYELLLPRIKENGVLLFDNMLAGGRVTAPGDHENARAIHALNEKLASDPRVESVLLSVSDGLHLCRKKAEAAGISNL